MAKLVKWTSNIDLDRLVLCLTSDPETCAEKPTFIFHFEHFDVLNFEIN